MRARLYEAVHRDGGDVDATDAEILRQNAEHRVMPECHDRLFRATQASDFFGLRPGPNAQTTVPTPGPNLPAVALEHVNRTLVGPKPVDFMQARVQRDHLTVHPGDQQRLT